MCNCYGDNPQRLPKSAMDNREPPPRVLDRSIGHYKEFVRACLGGESAAANFDYSGPLTEIIMLGIAAIRADKKLHWDAERMTFANAPEADEFLRSHYRKDWQIEPQ